MELKPGYKQTEVGVLPENWDVTRLRDVAQIRSGIAKNSNVVVNDPVLVHYLRVANVQDGFLDLSEMSKIEVSRSNLKRYAVLPGDVLMNEGGDLDKLGRGSIWLGQFDPCVHQNHVFVVRCGSRLSPQYLNKWSGAAAARRYFMVAGKQTTNLASINKTALGGLSVATPPLQEQRAIAETLGDVDELLVGLEQVIAKKRDLKKAAMQVLLTGKKRLPGFAVEWEVKQLGEVVQIRKGQLITSDTICKGDIPVIAGGKQPAYFHNLANRKGCTITVSASGASAGYVALYKMPIFASDCSTISEDRSYSIDFIYYQLLLKQQLIYSSQTGGAQPHIHAADLRPIEITVPNLPEQTAIAEALTEMDSELTVLELRLAKTRALKQGMMQQLLTGKVRLI
ncbi:MAG: restriction endonuclease subunit S [Chthonomonadales bacterium]